MKIVKTWYLAGPNFYSEKQHIEALLSIPSPRFPVRTQAKVLKDLGADFPSLRKLTYRQSSHGRLTRPQKLTKDSPLAALVLVLTSLLLENYDVSGHLRVLHPTKENEVGKWYIVFSCPYPRTGEEVLRLALRIVRASVNNKSIMIEKDLARIQAMYAKFERPVPKSELVFNAASERDIPVLRLAGRNLAQLGHGLHQRRVDGSNINTAAALQSANHKNYTRDILKRARLPVPDGGVAFSLDQTIRIANEIGFPVVIKPTDGSLGKGVTININSDEEVKKAYREATRTTKDGKRVIVEEQVVGHDYRVAVMGYKVVAVVKRIPARVYGDGKHNIRELIDAENKNPKRNYKQGSPLKPIKIPSDLEKVLRSQKLKVTSVPKKGQEVFVRANANVSTGGEAIDETMKIHPKNKILCEFAARMLSIQSTGLDLMCPDIRKPISEIGGWIIEMNSRPDIDLHHYPFRGRRRDVAADIVRAIFPGESSYRIPIFSVTGTNGKTTTTRLISFLLQPLKKNMATVTTGSTIIGGEEIYKKGSSYSTTRAALMDPTVEVAVLELAHIGLLEKGLGYDRSDVSIVTNVQEEHLDERSPKLRYPEVLEDIDDIARLKSIIPKHVSPNGLLVLNAEDSKVVRMATKTKAEKIYFSLEQNNSVIKRHLASGGIAYVAHKGKVIRREGKWKRKTLLRVADIPATIGGKASYNVQNVLGAMAAVLENKVLPIKTSSVISQLKMFGSTAEQNPGRLNVTPIGDVTAVVDYAHNPDGYRTILQLLKDIPYKRLVGVIKAKGNRPDSFIRTVGKIAGENFDEIYVKDPSTSNLEGRNAGEVANLIIEGAREAGMLKGDIHRILDEKKAVRTALKQAQPGDLVVIFAHDITGVNNVVKKFAEKRNQVS